MSEEENKYQIEYYKNEYDANRRIAFGNLIAGAFLFIIWILYLVRFFPIHEQFFFLVNIIFPIDIFILVSPMFYLKSKRIKKPGFKYFLIFSFLMVVAVINVLLPKHGIIGWAIVIVLTNHFYNPKLGKIVFGVTVFSLLICMYMSMFLGEYDPNLVGDGLVGGQIAYPFDGNSYYLPDDPRERFEFLHSLLEQGENRYLKVFIFYYLPRVSLLGIIFYISNSLNKRTYKLLISEIRVNSEQEKMNTELEVAKEIQLATLPKDFVTTELVEIVGELKAAKEVGGDFYDYMKIDEHRTALIIGDVSGKGVPAAMFMMKTITCFKNFTTPNKTPAQILKEMNKAIYESNNMQMFVTCFLAILDKRTGELQYANAGHNPPIIGTNHNFRFLKCNPGFILGGLADAFVVDEKITMKPGESITLYTDGITEARNLEGDFFGEERLISLFNKGDYTCTVELHHVLKDAIAVFVGKAPQSDDITLITMKYHGDRYSYSEEHFDGVMENIPQTLEFIEKFCNEHDIPQEFKTNLLVVGDELVSNIIKYGYENKGGDVFIRLLYNIDKKELVLTVIDVAEAFNQLEVNNPKVSGDPSTQRIGGLGILIVKKIMSEYAYDRINGKNILVLRKRFE